MAESQCSGCPSASSCSAEQRENCSSAQGPQSMLEPANKYSKIKKVIGIVSGKGGVGKSFVTACLASAMKKSRLFYWYYGCGYYRPVDSKNVWSTR